MTRRSTSIYAMTILTAAVVVLLAMGRIPFCKCGIISLWSSDVQSNQQSQQLTDPYTFTHIIHGAILYGLLWLIFGKRVPTASRFLLAAALESGWEILENTDFVINRYREATISLDYYGDSIFNSIGDIFAMMFGFWLALKLPARITAMMMLAIDLALLFLIRDSLAVNIIMLIHPIEVIKQWQIR
jgi:hypothetical protein